MRLLLLFLSPELRRQLRPQLGPQDRHRRLPVLLAPLACVLGAARGAGGAVRSPSIVQMLGVNTSQSVGALSSGLVSLARLAKVCLAVGPDVGQTTGVLAGVVTDIV